MGRIYTGATPSAGAGGTGSSAGGAVAVEVVDVKDSSGDPVEAASFANNSTVYFDLAASSTMEFQLPAGTTETLQIGLTYAMSAASAAAVSVDLELAVVAVGGAPTVAYGTAQNASLSPGNTTNVQNDKPSGWTVTPAAAGDVVRGRLTRKSDSHPGEMRIIQVTMEPA